MTTQPLATAPPLLDLVRQVAPARFGQDGPGERFAHWTRRLVLDHANEERSIRRAWQQGGPSRPRAGTTDRTLLD